MLIVCKKLTYVIFFFDESINPIQFQTKVLDLENRKKILIKREFSKKNKKETI